MLHPRADLRGLLFPHPGTPPTQISTVPGNVTILITGKPTSASFLVQLLPAPPRPPDPYSPLSLPPVNGYVASCHHTHTTARLLRYPVLSSDRLTPIAAGILFGPEANSTHDGVTAGSSQGVGVTTPDERALTPAGIPGLLETLRASTPTATVRISVSEGNATGGGKEDGTRTSGAHVASPSSSVATSYPLASVLAVRRADGLWTWGVAGRAETSRKGGVQVRPCWVWEPHGVHI